MKLTVNNLQTTPRPSQVDAFSEWIKNDCLGTIIAATGFGKSLLAVMIHHFHNGEKMLIVVYTEHLMQQFYEVFKKELNIEIGRIGGGYDEEKQVTVAIINSIRERKMNYDILIIDEAHHIVSPKNLNLLHNNYFKRIMAMTATIYRDDYKHKLLLKSCPIIFEFKQDKAIKKGILSPYNVINVPTYFNDDERYEYEELTETIKIAMQQYGGFLEVRRNLKDSICAQAMSAIQRRRQLINSTQSKVDKVVELLKEIEFNKVMIFNEYQKTADKLYGLLQPLYKVGLYHSGLKTNERKETLEKYRTGEFDILICVKATDEGIDVPDTDTAIILASTSQIRQTIQRAGRVLRYVEGKTANIYNLYIPNTKDEKDLRGRLRGFSGVNKIIWR